MNNHGRRASLPVQSLTNGAGNRSFKQRKKKKEKKKPCVELARADSGDRDDYVSEDLKEFMHNIEPEDSEDEERYYRDLPYNEKVRLRNKLLLGSNNSLNSDILKHLGPSSTSSSRRGSRRASHTSDEILDFLDSTKIVDTMVDEEITEDEYQQYLAYEKKVTKFTEMEIVALWNQFKLNFPHGTVSKPQLKELLQKVFPKCTTPDIITGNIFRTFDAHGKGKIEFRELLMTFVMCMVATPEEKLHWLFRLYDVDQNASIDEDEMVEVFERLYKVALGAENASGPPKPPTPPPPPETKKNKNKGRRKSSAVDDLSVTKMSSKMNKSDQRYKGLKKRPTKEQRKAAEEEALQRQQDEEAAIAAAAAEQEKLNNIEEEGDKFDPVARAEEIFKDLDINGDGSVDEDEFVSGCLSDENFLFMLENFTCDFLWGDGFEQNSET